MQIYDYLILLVIIQITHHWCLYSSGPDLIIELVNKNYYKKLLLSSAKYFGWNFLVFAVMHASQSYRHINLKHFFIISLFLAISYFLCELARRTATGKFLHIAYYLVGMVQLVQQLLIIFTPFVIIQVLPC